MNRLSPDEARDLLLTIPVKPRSRLISIPNSLGRVLAEDLKAKIPVPPFDRSPYDGYALRGEDTRGASREKPAVLTISEEIRAGSVPTMDIKPGFAAKILTGAPIPKGADAVIKYENTAFTDRAVQIFAPVSSGSNLVRAGEDIAAGVSLAACGTVISPAHMGMLAGQGLEQVSVYRRPRAALLSTGSELARAGEPLSPGQIYNSNTYTLGGLLLRQGALPVQGGIVPDDPLLIAGTMDRLLGEYDLLITTGGASVGDYDCALRAARLLGARVLFWKCAMRPGGAMMAAIKDDKLILSLSGNPGAAIIGLLVVGLPFIRKLCGRSEVLPEEFDAVMQKPYQKNSPVTRFLGGRLRIVDTIACFEQTEGGGSGQVSPFLGCDLIGKIPAGSPGLEAGERIRVMRI